MCLFWRKAIRKQQVEEPRRGQQSQPPTPNLKPRFRKPPEDSSLDLSTSYTISQSLSKESRGSRNSQTSTGSAISLASLKGLLSDGAQIFTYKDVLKATENFTPARKLGSGTFRGTIAGRKVTVVVEKRLSTDVDFVAEVKSICNLHHSSLAKLIGGCISGDQLYLVYEYIAGANLRQCLCSPFVAGFTTLKSWTTRLRIALDVAKGLEYLHDHASPPFVHKYIKSTSILLDDDLHARIANVGVARIRGESTADPSPMLLANSAGGKETDSPKAHRDSNRNGHFHAHIANGTVGNSASGKERDSNRNGHFHAHIANGAVGNSASGKERDSNRNGHFHAHIANGTVGNSASGKERDSNRNGHFHAHIANGAVGNSASGKERDSNPNSSGEHFYHGESRSAARSLRRSRSVKITGTHGYMAPEYSLSGVVTPKLDVFAFGIVLLEILSGQEPVKLQKAPGETDMKKTVLPDVIAAIFSDSEPRSRIRSWIDPLLRDAFPLECACRAALLAKKCVDANPDMRPSMRHVALSLEQIYMTSKQWEDNMLASKDLMTCTLTAR